MVPHLQFATMLDTCPATLTTLYASKLVLNMFSHDGDSTHYNNLIGTFPTNMIHFLILCIIKKAKKC